MPDSIVKQTYALFANPISRKITSELENLKADVLLFPPIKTEKVCLDEAAIKSLKNLQNFDWLIFPDVLAVDYFLENLEENAIDFYELDFLRICAVGESVADQLRFSSIHSDVISETTETNDVFGRLISYIGEKEFKKLRFLFPKNSSTEEELTEKITANDAKISELPIYSVNFSQNLELTKLKTLLKGGAIDEFVFCSPTDFIALKHYFKTEKISDILAEIKVSTADGAMLQLARENNLPRAVLFNLAEIDKVNW